jgi:hypothetical protein
LPEKNGQAPGKTPARLEAKAGQLFNGWDAPAEDQPEAGMVTAKWNVPKRRAGKSATEE